MALCSDPWKFLAFKKSILSPFDWQNKYFAKCLGRLFAQRMFVSELAEPKWSIGLTLCVSLSRAIRLNDHFYHVGCHLWQGEVRDSTYSTTRISKSRRNWLCDTESDLPLQSWNHYFAISVEQSPNPNFYRWPEWFSRKTPLPANTIALTSKLILLKWV